MRKNFHEIILKQYFLIQIKNDVTTQTNTQTVVCAVETRQWFFNGLTVIKSHGGLEDLSIATAIVLSRTFQ